MTEYSRVMGCRKLKNGLSPLQDAETRSFEFRRVFIDLGVRPAAASVRDYLTVTFQM